MKKEKRKAWKTVSMCKEFSHQILMLLFFLWERREDEKKFCTHSRRRRHDSLNFIQSANGYSPERLLILKVHCGEQQWIKVLSQVISFKALLRFHYTDEVHASKALKFTTCKHVQCIL
jgi:hypothetical protein